MTVLDVLQFVTNVALVAISADVLRKMKRWTGQFRGFVFLFLAFCGSMGILAAVSRIPDSGADVLTAIGVLLLLVIGCRPISRQ